MSVPGDVLAGRYRLESVIATGGMGVVWKGWDDRLQRAVAIKQLRPAAGIPEAEVELAKDRAMREARITGRLQHPRAVAVFDAVEHEGRPCLVMPFLESTALSDLLRDGPALPLGRVVRIGAEVSSALAAAHRLGIVHRDVKPGNILITPDGTAHISDFGISHALGDVTLTGTGWIHGTPAYLAPEVARGDEASYASDVFSLGATLYAALEGAPPFGTDANAIALLHKVAAGAVPAPDRAGPLTGFLLSMLSSDPQDRPSMEMVASVLADHTTYAEADERPATGAGEAPGATPPAGTAAAAGTAGAGAGTAAVATGSLPAEPGRRTGPAPGPGAAEETSTGLSSWFPQERGAGPGTADRRRSRAGLLAAAALVVALLGVGAMALLDDPGGDPGVADRTPAPVASDDPGSQTGSATPRSSPTPTPSATAPETSGTGREEPSTSSPAPEPRPAAGPSAPAESEEAPARDRENPPAAADRGTELTAAISDYYALMPGDREEGWTRMTADYQTNHAGGFESYDRFWSEITAVEVSDVEATPPDSVVATLTYTCDDGTVTVERTAYRLVDEDGILKIAASDVLSSRSS